MLLLTVLSAKAQDFTEVAGFFYHPDEPKVTIPYVAATLEPDSIPADPEAYVEPLVVRLDAVDCTTLVEYVTATLLAKAEKPDPQDSLFVNRLEALRYRNGQRGNYATRKHYFSEWISDAERHGLMREVTPMLKGSRPLDKTINFMSRNVKYYPQLQACRILLSEVRRVEAELSHKSLSYIPSAQISQCYDQLQHGDIVAFVTDKPGLDIQHVGFVWCPDPEQHAPQLFHASSALKQVTLDPTTLQDYALRAKNCIGIRVIRLRRSK